MKRLFTLALLSSALTMPAYAKLKEGDAAATFTTKAALAGNEFTFSLDEALKTGPVVLYFYPAAFTKGCSLEARAFADASEQFKSMGATIIGMSKDDIETLKRFSTADCGSKFAVGSDEDKKIMKAYYAVLMKFLPMSDRTSYSALSHEEHVTNTLAAVKKWRDANPIATIVVAAPMEAAPVAEPAK